MIRTKRLLAGLLFSLAALALSGAPGQAADNTVTGRCTVL